MSRVKFILSIILTIDLFILNIGVANIYLNFKFSQQNEEIIVQTPVPTLIPTVEPTILPTILPTNTPIKIYQNLPTPKPKRTVEYFAIPGSGSTLSREWVDVSGSDFYFDPAEHPGLIEVRFEVNLRLLNGNGTAFVRIFDVTHSIGVPSEVSASSQTSTLTTTDKINFWSGRNQYRIQIKTLTADTAIYESGRLRMIVEK